MWLYTVPGLPGAEHHQAEMRVLEDPNGTVTLEWTTDVLPDSYADLLGRAYQSMFEELVAAVNGHRLT